MASVSKEKNGFSVRAYQGDAKTLLAFNLPKAATKNLAGFTIRCEPKGVKPYFLHNLIQFETPADHAQDPTEPASSSINAPIHKFRWLHVPGSVHQGLNPVFGPYTYTVTPRYFDAKHSMLPLDPARSVAVTIDVGPFVKNGLSLGFTRGFTQSQAFVNHFGKDARIRPKSDDLLFDTSAESGVNAKGEHFTYEQEYEWLGFTARDRVFELLDEVVKKKSLKLDMFAYDLNEPNLMDMVLTLAKQGRVRVILDNASLHHSTTKPKPEDKFEQLFNKAKKSGAELMRGKFGRYAHDKVFVVKNGTGPRKVLTGSTNFSVTGFYVNSNHVLVFDDPKVAAVYADAFQTAWDGKVKQGPFESSPLANSPSTFSSKTTPPTEITFAPHTDPVAKAVLQDVAARIAKEGNKGKSTGSVLFAVMQVDGGVSPVYTALSSLHKNTDVFSYGISDTTKGIKLYAPGRKTGVLVTGKPANTILPPPFNQVPNITLGHQIHHKFVVCGFNRADAVVYCGSSNLAEGGEANNGDNLLAIRDTDVATVFAIEAAGLVDHFNFLDKYDTGPKSKAKKKAPASLKQAALSSGFRLSTTDRWVAPYYDPKDLHCSDRLLFAS